MRHITIAAVGMLAFATPAFATSGPGCLVVVNVATWDTLKVRAKPSAASRIVDQLRPGAHGIIRLDKACAPKSLPWGQRWCKISHYSGNGVTRGYVKARFVRDRDCP